MELLEIRKSLADSIESRSLSDPNYSSHWIEHTKNRRLVGGRKIRGMDGFGTKYRRIPFLQFLHNRAQREVFDEYQEVSKSHFFKLGQRVAKLQRRLFDGDMLRHVYTLDFLCNNYFNQSSQKSSADNSTAVVCVIGDGRTNFTSLALESRVFGKVIHVNLPEILLADLDLLERMKISGKIQLASNREELLAQLKDSTTSLILVRAQDAEILTKVGVDLFVNIASMQEMTLEVINRYFSIIESNECYFYFCNREFKRLYGGEMFSFFDLPWERFRVLFHEECGWHLGHYTLKNWKLLGKRKYDGVVLHRVLTSKKLMCNL